MKISLNWLRNFVEIPRNADPRELAQLFTTRTAEVEGAENQGAMYDHMVVGQIMEIHPHPDADKLRVTKTSVGKETLQIVCGGNNLYEGMYVAVALTGASVRWHGEGEPVVLKPVKIRGVESYGMICAANEIGMEEELKHDDGGIVDLSALKPTVGAPLAEVFEKDDVILTIDNKSLTHRPDLWGHYGIAREMAAITGKKFIPLEISTKYPSKPELEIDVKEKKLCPRYLGTKIEGIKVEPSPVWLQRSLKTIGYRCINNIVDVTNYVMAELGQPLHAFDASKVENGIIVRLAKKDEKIHTLDGEERKLPANTLVITDHKKAIAIAGVMGSANSEVDQNTTSIIVESANFHPSSIRKTSVKLGLRTEAVMRFEKSLDPHLAELAMDRVCELILKICPTAKIASAKTDIKNFAEKKNLITLDITKVSSKIGQEISIKEAVRLLNTIGFTSSEKTKNKLQVEIPSFRPMKDISIEDDLVEEIARLHGYENIPAVLPKLPIKLPVENKERKLKHFARQILSSGLGFDEVYNYSFYSLDDIRKNLIPEELHEHVLNYLSEDQTHLRVSLVPNMLKNVVHNLKYYDSFKIYEIGRTYEDLQEYFPIEEKKISACIVRGKKEPGEIFLEAKGALEAFLSTFRAPALEMRKGEALCPSAHPNRYAAYFTRADNTEIARVYELHPLIQKNHDLENVKIAFFEINFTKLASFQQREMKYKTLPKFPNIVIDISILIDKKMTVGTVEKTLTQSDRKLIQSVQLFDLYEGSNIPSDKKAFAFKITLRSDERTLTDEDMKQVQQKIFDQVKEIGGEIRGA